MQDECGGSSVAYVPGIGCHLLFESYVLSIRDREVPHDVTDVKRSSLVAHRLDPGTDALLDLVEMSLVEQVVIT